MHVERVQRWVMSAVLVTVLFIFGAGLTILGQTQPDKHGSRVGLMAIAGVIGLIAILGVRVLHAKSLLTPWLVAAVIPAGVGWWIAMAVR